MARARNIKPGFFKNELLVEQSAFTRLLFIGLWTLADREGRIEDRPKRIKLELFPYDQDDINACLDTLAEFEFIDRYEAGGKKVIQIVSFLKHQTPHGTEKDSELPGKTGDFTVNERTDKGYASGVKRAINVKSNGNNVTPPLSNTAAPVNNSGNNALNPESLFLNPESNSLVDGVDGMDDFENSDEIQVPKNDAERALGQHAVLVKTSAKRFPNCPHDEIVALYHEALPGLPRSLTLMNSRKKAIGEFWKWVFESKKSNGESRATTQAEAMEWIKAYFERASDNEFVMANGKRTGPHANWKSDLDYLLSESGRVQVIEKTREAA